jgi:predicted nucleic acid-binding protein
MTKSKVYLLDSNVLIALATPEHSLNTRAAVWFRKGYRFATCPITQGALVRFHLRAGVDATVESAKLLLETICAIPRHEFWPDDASYLEMPTTGIIGHRQVTDAYLAFLASKHGGSLATMDQALAAVHTGTTLIERFPADA